MPTAEARKERILRPRSGWVPVDLGELWRYRELLLFLAWRDILVRYKQTALGVAWAIIQPLLTMVVFTIIFGKLAKFPSNGAPYALITCAALLPWQFFVNALSESSNSLVASSNMISKVYFPRLIVPCSSVISGTVDFLISFVVLLGVMCYYHTPVQPQILALPFFFAIALVGALALGVWLSALNVKYRDVRYVVPFLTRMGMYVSPVAFLTSMVPERWIYLYSLNPMVGAIDGFRWCILGEKFEPHWPALFLGTAFSLALLVAGVAYFRNTEKTFADVI